MNQDDNTFNQNINKSQYDVPGHDVIKYENSMQELRERKQLLNISQKQVVQASKNLKIYRKTYVKCETTISFLKM